MAGATKGVFYTNTDSTYPTSPTALVVKWEKSDIPTEDRSIIINWEAYICIQATGGSYFRTVNTLNNSSGYGTRIIFPNCVSATDRNSTFTSVNKIPFLQYTTGKYFSCRFNTGHVSHVVTNATTGAGSAWDASGTTRTTSDLNYNSGVAISQEIKTLSNNVIKSGTMWRVNSGTVTLAPDEDGKIIFKCNLAGWLGWQSANIGSTPDIYFNSSSTVQEEEVDPTPVGEETRVWWGINGVPKKVTHIYLGVNGVPKLVQHCYIGTESGIKQIF